MGTEVQIIATATAQIKEGAIVSMADLLEVVAPMAAPVQVSAPTLPARLTEDELKAFTQLPSLYGKVMPASQRLLTQEEVKALVEERTALDAAEKAATRRKAEIRKMVFDHLDLEVKASGASDAEVDGAGHFLVKGEILSPETGFRLTREVRNGSVDVPVAALADLAADPTVDWFTHQNYLDMTREVRVLDEAKVAILMRKAPETVARALKTVARRGQKVASCYQRKIK